MNNDSIDEITERLNRALTMTPPNRPTTSVAPPGLNEVQKEQIRQMIQSIARVDVDSLLDEGVDQPIGAVTANLEELDRVPDIVRSIREFSGKPGEFNSWRKSVDRVLGLFNSLQNTGRYYAILHVIRTKITGDADTALESYRTPLDWSKIKKCLMMHYSDKRDIGTLEYQMTVLCQGNRTINEFYQAVYQHLSLILDKVSCLDLDESSLCAMTNTYREKALDTFIRGLSGDLPRLLSIREPTSLPQALHICLKLDNMTFRRNYAHGQTSRAVVQKDRIGSTNPTDGRKFYPELAHTGTGGYFRPPVLPRYNPVMNFNPNIRQPTYHTRFPNQWIRPRNENDTSGRPRPLGVEPMEIDNSTQTKQVNYANRPPFYQNPKRPANGSFQGPINKMQRNFHINTEYAPENAWCEWTCYPPEGNEVDTCPPDDESGDVQEYIQRIPEEYAVTAGHHEQQPNDVQPLINFLD